MQTQLRDYQSAAIDNTRHAITAGFSRIVIQAPTGSGKTKIAAAVVSGALEKNNRIAFLVPMITLIDQTYRSFYDEGFKHLGVLQGDHPLTDTSAPIQICSIDTLSRRHYFPDVAVVIVDECHRRSRYVRRWMEVHPEVIFLGLTATPWTKGMGQIWDHIVPTTTILELIDREYLSPFEVYAPSAPDLSNLRIVAGDYHNGDLASRAMRPAIVADVISSWLRLGENRPTICYAVNRLHAQALRDDFEAQGVPTAYVDAYTTREEREELREQFQRGDVKVITNVGVLTTGVDWDVRCIVLARPTRSLILFVQMIGRGLRPKDGDHCLILDHSDSHEQHGFVTDIPFMDLDDGKEANKSVSPEPERLPRKCPECSYIIPAEQHICSQCGFELKRKNRITGIAGELVPLNPKGFSQDQVIETYAQLLHHARVKGYKEGWAFHACKGMTGEGPVHPVKYTLPPTTAVKNYIKYMNIKRARSRRTA